MSALLWTVMFLSYAGAAEVVGGFAGSHCVGNTLAIVSLPQWKWSDIGKQCPLLADMGYCGVQIFVALENNGAQEFEWPWHSYKLQTAFGTQSEFRNMFKVCREVGVRIYTELELGNEKPDNGQDNDRAQNSTAAISDMLYTSLSTTSTLTSAAASTVESSPAEAGSETVTELRTTSTTTEPLKTTKVEPDWQRTVIFMHKVTELGEQLFLRGGSSAQEVVGSSDIPIRHNKLKFKSDTPQRDKWTVGDNFLDWEGHEPGQTYLGNGGLAEGTPAVWTTFRRGERYYSELNRYNLENMWLVDIMMDCSHTEDGFFKVRAYMQDGEREPGTRLSATCSGLAAREIPRVSAHHYGLCGKINMFRWGKTRCQIDNYN